MVKYKWCYFCGEKRPVQGTCLTCFPFTVVEGDLTDDVVFIVNKNERQNNLRNHYKLQPDIIRREQKRTLKDTDKVLEKQKSREIDY